MESPATNNVRMIAAEQQRRHIPGGWLLVFEDMTNEGIASLARDPAASAEKRTWASWELDYRETFGVFYDFDPQGIIRRSNVATEPAARAVLDRERRETTAVHERAEALRRRAHEAGE